jgi:hypothetical protein
MVTVPVGVHLVGSFPFDTESEVFDLVSDKIGTRLRRMPDGETEERKFYYNWHIGLIYARARAQLEWVSPAPGRYPQLPWFKRRRGADLSGVDFGTFGYAEWARKSYEIFKEYRSAGRFPDHTRFQVNMISPLVPLKGLFDPAIQGEIEPAYERAILADLDEICASIPHRDLSIQWEHVYEIAYWEHFAEGVLSRIERYSSLVPPDAELGHHLCYGDFQHKHFMEPRDGRVLTDLANAIAARVSRSIQFLHVPVPVNRDDDEYFAPFADLRLHDETELYLGLVHHADGVEGTKRRIAAAARHVASFGVATECGFGRRPPEQIADLLDIHRTVSAPITSS